MAIMKGGGYVQGRPKKLVKDKVSTRYCPRHLVIRQKSVIVGRVNRTDTLIHNGLALICNLPSVEVWVRKEYLTDHQSGHGEFVKGVWVSCKSIPGRTFLF